MGRQGKTLVEEGHIVQMLAPVDITVATSSKVIFMGDWSHVTFICLKGAGDDNATIRVEECTGFGGTAASTIVFDYAQCLTAGCDVLSALTAATTAGVAIGTSTGTTLAIEIDADELTDGYAYLRLKCADPGSDAHLGCVEYDSGL